MAETDKHPKLMIVCEDTSVTPHVVEFLKTTGLGDDDILAVDSNSKGEMSEGDWEADPGAAIRPRPARPTQGHRERPHAP